MKKWKRALACFKKRGMNKDFRLGLFERTV
jgi:hypothetical protein